MKGPSPSIRKPRGSSPWVIAALVLAALIAYESGSTVVAVLLVLGLFSYLVMRRPSAGKTKKAVVIVAVTAILGVVLVVGVIVLIVVGISTGEQQSHDRSRQVAKAYATAKRGAPESAVREQLGDPFTVHKHVLPSNPAADVHCLIYRVLLPTVELVPYRLCYTNHRLVTKYRGWDNIPDD